MQPGAVQAGRRNTSPARAAVRVGSSSRTVATCSAISVVDKGGPTWSGSRPRLKMRIWDLDPSLLCRQHLLGEHRELHGLWNILMHNKRGYRQHPETKRWVDRQWALRQRHEALSVEIMRRGFQHHSPLPFLPSFIAQVVQDQFVHTIEEQVQILRSKGCGCRV